MSLEMGHRAIFLASVLPGVRAPELLLNSEEIAKFTPEVGYWKPGRHGESNSSAAVPKGTRVKSPSGPKTNSWPEKRTAGPRTNNWTENRTAGPRTNSRPEKRTAGPETYDRTKRYQPGPESSDRTGIIRPDRKTND